MRNEPTVRFARADYSRVPYGIYHDPAIFEAEMERIFRGPTWLFVGLEAEIPNAGDFRTTYLGETPVVYNRGTDGRVHAFVNRCAHRGAVVRREQFGNAPDHTCIYHRWSYDLEGNLLGVPFQRGVNGKGGLDPAFDKRDHGLMKLRVEIFRGLIFATFQGDAVEPLAAYLGPNHVQHLSRITHKPLKVLGYMRQHIAGNWKLYNENLRDQYHGSLLHEFQSTFGIARITQNGGAKLDPRHRHNISWSQEGTDDEEEAKRLYRDAKVKQGVLTLKDDSYIWYEPEWDDGISISICSIFPNACVQQIRNSLATRQIRPKGMDAFELYWTIFGYADDSPAMTRHRLLQSNMVGPAGLISMEDGEAVEIAHRAPLRDGQACSVIEMGGGGRIPTDIAFKASDIAIRGFWSYYAELMGMEPDGAYR
ncbi:MAG: Rieske 2Fe-2S domain-containing protein [Alphaproteobacteria bacterium]|nr:Rieske 2Fe-2S domain-containing protein [Alphaproteobacteria bacterium]